MDSSLKSPRNGGGPPTRPARGSFAVLRIGGTTMGPRRKKARRTLPAGPPRNGLWPGRGRKKLARAANGRIRRDLHPAEEKALGRSFPPLAEGTRSPTCFAKKTEAPHP